MPSLRRDDATAEAEGRLGAARVVGGWASLIVVLVLIMVGFGGPSVAFRSYMYGAGALLMLLTALAVMFPRHPRQSVSQHHLPSGAPSAALALICLIVVVASVYSFWIVFLALPLVGFVVARFYGEVLRRHRHKTSPR